MAAQKALDKPLSDMKTGAFAFIDDMVVDILAKYRQYCSSQVYDFML